MDGNDIIVLGAAADRSARETATGETRMITEIRRSWKTGVMGSAPSGGKSFPVGVLLGKTQSDRGHPSLFVWTEITGGRTSLGVKHERTGLGRSVLRKTVLEKR